MLQDSKCPCLDVYANHCSNVASLESFFSPLSLKSDPSSPLLITLFPLFPQITVCTFCLFNGILITKLWAPLGLVPGQSTHEVVLSAQGRNSTNVDWINEWGVFDAGGSLRNGLAFCHIKAVVRWVGCMVGVLAMETSHQWDPRAKENDASSQVKTRGGNKTSRVDTTTCHTWVNRAAHSREAVEVS